MNIKSRLKKIESRIKGTGEAEIVWDYSNTSTKQLKTLEELILTDLPAAKVYNRKLIEKGFLSYCIGGKSYTGFDPHWFRRDL